MTTSETPLLLIIFNRPEKVRALIEALSKVQPKYLYIAADGPRKNVPTDKERCTEAQKIATTLPWECAVRTKFSDINLGCDQAIPESIDWFFEHVESGIILEDDCIPHPSFFSFCGEILEKYKDNEKIMHISGNNFQDGQVRGNASYYFSHFTAVWGWATWRRAWRQFHPAVEDMDTFFRENRLNAFPFSKKAKRFGTKSYMSKEHWDSLWQYAILYANGLNITPNKNLVSNTGFGFGATHTTSEKHPLANVPAEPITDIVHSSEIKVNIEADAYYFNKVFFTPLSIRIKLKVKKLMRKHLPLPFDEL